MFKSMCNYRKLYIALLADTPGWSSLYSHYHFAWTMIFGRVGLAYIPWPRCRRPCCEYKNESVSSFMGRLALPSVPSAHPYLPAISWATAVENSDFDLTLPGIPDDWRCYSDEKTWCLTDRKSVWKLVSQHIQTEHAKNHADSWFVSQNPHFCLKLYHRKSHGDRGRTFEIWSRSDVIFGKFADLESKQLHSMWID